MGSHKVTNYSVLTQKLEVSGKRTVLTWEIRQFLVDTFRYGTSFIAREVAQWKWGLSEIIALEWGIFVSGELPWML